MNNALYNQIRIFQSIAREGNISAAARKLEITPPSVSNRLSCWKIILAIRFLCVRPAVLS